MNLFEINERLDEVLTLIEANGGELSPEAESLIATLETSRDAKIKAIVGIIHHEEARIDACNKEMKRLNELCDKAERKRDWLKSYLGICIGTGSAYDGGTFKIGWRKASKVEIDPEFVHELPQEFLRVIPEKREPDKIALKKALEAGMTLNGVTLKQEQHIQIR